MNYISFEHYKGHHARAATYDDPATARYGESLYRFLPRTLSGSFINGWRLEAQRIAQTKSAWHKSPLLWSTLVAVGSLLTPFLMLVPALGGMEYTPFAVKITVFLLLQSAIACLMLETINYIEHYGLQRQSAGGKREPFGMNHAWNADCFVTNSLLAIGARSSLASWKPAALCKPAKRSSIDWLSRCLKAKPRLWFA
ncbi:MAG: fatty acid desaturase [Polaromonas sp.]|nr:fatty acid desaturase [Polaromonas sp.]